jgi:hydrogenase small subunit
VTVRSATPVPQSAVSDAADPPNLQDGIDVLWITAGLGCDGDTIALTAATQPSIEELVLGLLPGVPRMRLHNPFLATETGDSFLEIFRQAAAGQLAGPFILVVEGSIPNEAIKAEGYWAAWGVDHDTGEPILTCDWIDGIAPHAWAVVAAGTCATYGGIHAMEGNPTGCMGLPDYLGWEWRSHADVPIVCVPGCPVQPDNMSQTLLYLLEQVSGRAPMIPLDAALRPTFLFNATVHEGCDRGGYYEQADFAAEYGSPRCIVKLGCWGPVVVCNVPKRGWMNGIGGCPNVGGICIGCTMPGFPDKFMPFMEEPPGARMSTSAVIMYGRTVRALRAFTKDSLDQEPAWRAPGSELMTGHQPQQRTETEERSPPATDSAIGP